MAKLPVQRPVDRLSYIADLCREKAVLDIGCFDETALAKRDTEHWLHGRIRAQARCVTGVDSSNLIPPEGIRTGGNSIILRGDGVDIEREILQSDNFDIIVAGEFIEHIESPLRFFKNMKQAFPGRVLVISTPNGACFANTLLGSIGREVQHPDHLHNFSFKILNTLCRRSGFQDWEIVPYRFYATEMILQSRGVRRIFVVFVERCIRVVERLFPLLSFGYIVRAKL
ncbi:MAG: class I SAM-dependent methyltransferase [Candidatus Nitrotoga sp.]|nr:class I SAM-dependent methyltransferase [Candidatus Nitrotoga sp.]